MAAGLKLPKVTVPKAPKAPIDPKKVDPKKAQEAAQKAADGAKKKAGAKVAAALNPKKLLKIGIVLLIVLVVFLVVMCKTAWAPGPKEALMEAAETARDKPDNIEAFIEYFTPESVRRLETAWGTSKTHETFIPRPGSWEWMRDSILNSNRQVPKIIAEQVQGKQAVVTIELDGVKRSIKMVLNDDDEWKIDVPTQIQSIYRLPPGAPADVVAKAEEPNPAENVLWWEDREAAAKAEEEKKKKKKGFFKCSVVSARSADEASPRPAPPLALLALLSLCAAAAVVARREGGAHREGGASALLDPATVVRLGGLKLRARYVVEGFLSGLHRSPHRGSSVEFAEYKEYAPGDDIKHIDWRAYARNDRYYVKQFEEETNLRAYMLLDTSGSMQFGSGEVSKLTYAQTLAASMAHLLLRQTDAVGLMCFNATPTAFLPPSSRTRHLDDLINILEQPTAEHAPTSLQRALDTIAERVRRRSVIIVLSDMLDTTSSAGHLLRVLRSRGMDVALFHVIDPDELTLPYEGLTQFEGLEGDGMLLVDPDDIRATYQQLFREHIDGIARTCQESQVDYHRVVTTTPFDEPLLAFLNSRR
jgi:uncharacterized protein (DUF58 family)